MNRSIVVIAGTSVGGSSYTHRILTRINEMQPRIVAVVVKEGPYEQQVRRAVQNSIAEIKTLNPLAHVVLLTTSVEK